MSAVDKAPERIWLDLPSFNGAVGFAPPERHRNDGWPEYIRADLAAPSAPAEVEGLVERWDDLKDNLPRNFSTWATIWQMP